MDDLTVTYAASNAWSATLLATAAKAFYESLFKKEISCYKENIEKLKSLTFNDFVDKIKENTEQHRRCMTELNTFEYHARLANISEDETIIALISKVRHDLSCCYNEAPSLYFRGHMLANTIMCSEMTIVPAPIPNCPPNTAGQYSAELNMLCRSLTITRPEIDYINLLLAVGATRQKWNQLNNNLQEFHNLIGAIEGMTIQSGAYADILVETLNALLTP